MAVPNYQTVPVECPECKTRFSTPILTIIDPALYPQTKEQLLSGQLNVAVCPQCGSAGMLNLPLVYHDPRKKLLFTFMPPDLSASETDKQRAIGDLTNQVISSLPSEERQAYLLQPRSFLSLESMLEAILEADGITAEMLEGQRAKADLIGRLLEATDDASRKTIAEENESLIDYDFFQLLTLNIEMAVDQGPEEIARQLETMRDQLLNWTTKGRDLAQREDALRTFGEETTRESLLDSVVEAELAGERAKVETLVSVGRPLIDYVFYQQLTVRIETIEKAGKTSESAALTNLRNDILEMTAAIDARVEEEAQQAAGFLQDLLDSSDPEAFAREHFDRVDPLFLEVLQGNLDALEQGGNAKEAERLKEVLDIVVGIVEESQPPEIRLISRLISAEYPDGTEQLLADHQAQLDERFLEAVAAVAKDFEQRGQKELSERLVRIGEQAASLVASS